MQLRQYQHQSKDDIRAAFQQGHKRVILCSPTGSGKTVTFSSIANDCINKGNTVMIVVDRRELITQTLIKLRSYNLFPSMITAGKQIESGNCYLATIQTLIRRQFPPADLIIIDEAHKQSFNKVLSAPAYAKTHFIGATATPIRTGRQNQLSEFYTKIIEPITIEQLIDQGFLCPVKTYGAEIDMSGVHTVAGDYNNGEMFMKFDRPALYKGVVDNYMKFCAGQKTLCFNVNVEHSIKTTEAFLEAGVLSAHIDAKTPKKDREEILEMFNNGEIDVLNNCEILTTGYDQPSIQTVIINRATKSLPLYLQMCGRGSRPFKGKDHFKVIDQGGNVFRFGFWDDPRSYSLDHKAPKGEGVTPLKECPEDKISKYYTSDLFGRNLVPHVQKGCGALVHLSTMKCPYCGFKFPKPERQLAESEFKELKKELRPELRFKAAENMSLDELIEVRKVKGYHLGWIVRQIMERPDLSLEHFAQKMNYSSGWIKKMNELYA